MTDVFFKSKCHYRIVIVKTFGSIGRWLGILTIVTCDLWLVDCDLWLQHQAASLQCLRKTWWTWRTWRTWMTFLYMLCSSYLGRRVYQISIQLSKTGRLLLFLPFLAQVMHNCVPGISELFVQHLKCIRILICHSSRLSGFLRLLQFALFCLSCDRIGKAPDKSKSELLG